MKASQIINLLRQVPASFPVIVKAGGVEYEIADASFGHNPAQVTLTVAAPVTINLPEPEATIVELNAAEEKAVEQAIADAAEPEPLPMHEPMPVIQQGETFGEAWVPPADYAPVNKEPADATASDQAAEPVVKAKRTRKAKAE